MLSGREIRRRVTPGRSGRRPWISPPNASGIGAAAPFPALRIYDTTRFVCVNASRGMFDCGLRATLASDQADVREGAATHATKGETSSLGNSCLSPGVAQSRSVARRAKDADSAAPAQVTELQTEKLRLRLLPRNDYDTERFVFVKHRHTRLAHDVHVASAHTRRAVTYW